MRGIDCAASGPFAVTPYVSLLGWNPERLQVEARDAAELARRFRSDLTPAYFLVGADGRVVASGPALGALPLPLPIG